MAAPSAWRQFNFFQASPVKDQHDLASSPDTFKNISDIACIAPSSQGLLVADIHGSIQIVDSDFELERAWIAHENGHVTHMLEKRGILVTLIEEVGVRYPILKIWDLEHKDKSSGQPPLLRSTKLQHGGPRPHPVSTLALSNGLSQLAVGLADGTVLFLRGLDQYLFSTTNQSLTYLPKVKVIHEAGDPITGLGFREPSNSSTSSPSLSDDPTSENLYLFIVTLSQVFSYQVTGRGTSTSIVIPTDDLGALPGCATMNQKSTDMIIARDEAIYLANMDGRGPSYAVEGTKTAVLTFRNYLVIVSPPFMPAIGDGSATVRRFAASGRPGNVPGPTGAKATNALASGGGAKGDISKVVVFDVENKYIAYSNVFRETVRQVFTCWGRLFVLTNESTLYRLAEATMPAKLEMLYNKNNFALAISIAKSQGLDDASVADIYRRYGDQFYKADDHEGAMDQYLKTIGSVQPSYVIRKYLDAQRIQCLAVYLQELHARGLANSDHTTLLLNAYTKMKDVERLDAFIKADSHKGTASSELPFDLETVIRVCRQAGYFDHAVYLARKYDRHDDYLRIQIEDAGKYKEALAYLRKLGPEASQSNLTRYGRILLEKLPEETTQLFIDICTGSGFSVTEENVEADPTKNMAGGGPSYLSYLAYNRNSTALPSDAASATGATIKEPPKGVKEVAPSSTGSGNEPGNRKRQSGVYSGSRGPSPPPASKRVIPGVRKPSPRVYFVHFVDHPEHFVRFLEAVALTRWGQRVDLKSKATEVKKQVVDKDETEGDLDAEADKLDRMAVWNTLIELYLSLSTDYAAQFEASKAKEKQELAKSMQAKALYVLKSPFEFDPTHALLVCSTKQFTEGLVLLWEQLGMYEDILRFWMDKEKELTASNDQTSRPAGEIRPSAEVLRYLQRYGESNPNLYPLVLRFLTSTPELLQRHTSDLTGILEHIEQGKIMPPLAVVQVLSRNKVASVGLVKPWLLRRISESKNEIDSDRRLIDSYRSETAARLKDIAELSDPNVPKMFHTSQCSAGDGPLELPVVHFMCKHSYHQRCLGEHETECPICARQHSVIRQLRRDNERLAQQHDVFLAEVEDNGGLSAIAIAFSQGLLNVPRDEGVAL